MCSARLKLKDESTVRDEDHFRCEGNTIRLFGNLRMHNASTLWCFLQKTTSPLSGAIEICLQDVEVADSGVIALLVNFRNELARSGKILNFTGTNPLISATIALYAEYAEISQAARRTPDGFVTQLGRATFEFYSNSKVLIEYLGIMIGTTIALLRRPSSGHWRGLLLLCTRAGIHALPIVVLINFLVGFVMAFQSAKQLKLYGANVYVADLVGISITRELAPLMTAIIVCGRTGAAFAAEVGSMKVNEEIDALRTLGLSPFAWLVVPRTFALIIVLPLLTLIADFAGISGGLVVGVTDLNVTFRGYLYETLTSVRGWDFATGLCKSFAFSIVIGLTACQKGFSAKGGPDGVGQCTTSAVVTSLFTIILFDAILTIAFRALNV